MLVNGEHSEVFADLHWCCFCTYARFVRNMRNDAVVDSLPGANCSERVHTVHTNDCSSSMNHQITAHETSDEG